eukprot:101505-Amphidinium_carterae.1
MVVSVIGYPQPIARMPRRSRLSCQFHLHVAVLRVGCIDLLPQAYMAAYYGDAWQLKYDRDQHDVIHQAQGDGTAQTKRGSTQTNRTGAH